jgi:hypothetical protein
MAAVVGLASAAPFAGTFPVAVVLAAGPELALPWQGLEPGVLRVRQEYLPALVVYQAAGAPSAEGAAAPGNAGGAAEEVFFARFLTDPSFKKVFKQFVLVRLAPGDLEKPYPLPLKPAAGKQAGANEKKPAPAEEDPAPAAGPAPSVAEVLDLRAERSSAVVLDFRERIVRRYDDGGGGDSGREAAAGRPAGAPADNALPRPSRLREELDRIWKVNKVFATKAREVEPLLEKSLYSFRAGEIRAAVLIVVPLEEKANQARMDPVLTERIRKMTADYRKRAEEGMTKGDQLDRERKYDLAIDAFDVVMRDFPFKDICQRAAKRKGEILRKVTFGGP